MLFLLTPLCNLSIWLISTYHSSHWLRNTFFLLVTLPSFSYYLLKSIFCFALKKDSAMNSNLVYKFRFSWVHLLALSLKCYVILNNLCNISGSVSYSNYRTFTITWNKYYTVLRTDSFLKMIYLLTWRSVTKRVGEKEIMHPLVYCPDGLQSQCWPGHSQKLHSRLPHRWQGPKHFCHLPLLKLLALSWTRKGDIKAWTYNYMESGITGSDRFTCHIEIAAQGQIPCLEEQKACLPLIRWRCVVIIYLGSLYLLDWQLLEDNNHFLFTTGHTSGHTHMHCTRSEP